MSAITVTPRHTLTLTFTLTHIAALLRGLGRGTGPRPVRSERLMRPRRARRRGFKRVVMCMWWCWPRIILYRPRITGWAMRIHIHIHMHIHTIHIHIHTIHIHTVHAACTHRAVGTNPRTHCGCVNSRTLVPTPRDRAPRR